MIGHHQLMPLLGEWSGEEEVLATAWTVAGAAQGRLSAAAGPGGGLIIDYGQQHASGAMTGHGVLVGDGWWWFDSYGFTPSVPGRAEWRNGELVLERRSDRGRTVTVLRINGGRLEQRIDTAVPADGPLAPLLRGSYTRHQDPPR